MSPKAVVIAIAVLLPAQSLSNKAFVGGPIYQGTELQVDLPENQHVKNFGAPADGKGLCVFASMSMAARWHNLHELEDVINRVNEGGGWPEKVDQVIKKFAPNLNYVQYEGTNPAILDKALSNGRPACVTYGYGERYGGSTIYHMVLLVHLDENLACVLDNNFTGSDKFEWMSRAEFLNRWIHPNGSGWAYVFIAAPPPPIPRN